MYAYHLHPSLRQYINKSWTASPNIIWDMRYDPRNPPPRLTAYPKYVVHPAIFSEPATCPATHNVRLLVQTSKYETHTVNVCSETFVAVGDVLYTLFRHLRNTVSRSEWNALSFSQQEEVSGAFFDRCRRAPNPQYEYSRGVRRVDLLRNVARFRGFTNEGCGTFRLLIGR